MRINPRSDPLGGLAKSLYVLQGKAEAYAAIMSEIESSR